MACKARPSLIGVPRVQVYASMAWVSASIPVEAVSRGGKPSVSPGSTMAILGAIAQSRRETLICRVVSLTTELRVTSLPVPAVVGMAMSGRGGSTNVRGATQSSAVPLLVARPAAALARSIGLPPPIATIASAPVARASSAAARHS
ncbi:MAG: hypothetical protein R2848_05170 [Thermomicrobiales bacterium]